MRIGVLMEKCAKADLTLLLDKAPASVRDQIFDHKPGAVRCYLDQEVRFDTKACYLGRPSNDVVQKMDRLASLTADASAPTELSPEQKVKLKHHPTVIQLSQRNKALTAWIHAAGYRPISAAQGTRLYEKKTKVEARLNSFKTRLRSDMIEKARKRHFRKADTVAFDSQFSAAVATQTFSRDARREQPIEYHLPERAAVVRFTCKAADGLSDQGKLTRRIQAIEARPALCQRQESCRRRRPRSYVNRNEPDASFEDSTEEREDQFPLECKPAQCIFCLGNERKPYEERVYECAKPNKMMNEVKKHLRKFSPQIQVPCPHPQCKAATLILPNVLAFKAHTASVHKIFLRDPAKC